MKNDCHTIKDFVESLRFCFEDPEIDVSKIDQNIGKDKTNLIATLLDKIIIHVPKRDLFLDSLKREGKESGLKPKEIFGTVRYLLTGSFQGLGIGDIIEMLDEEKIIRRLKKL